RRPPPRLRPLSVHRRSGRRRQALGPPLELHRRRRRTHRRGLAPRGAVPQRRRRRVRARIRSARRGVTDVFVGLDVGTSGVKALALRADGEIVARSERSYPLATPRPGWAEQDPDDWTAAAESALADLAVEPTAVGYSGQMHGLVALGADDRPLRPAILWNDQRTPAECVEIEERIGLDRLVELTGNRALPGFTAPKLLWLRNHEPATFDAIERIVLPKDYVRLRLEHVHA